MLFSGSDSLTLGTLHHLIIHEPRGKWPSRQALYRTDFELRVEREWARGPWTSASKEQLIVGEEKTG